MAQEPDDADFKARAVELVARKTKAARVMAADLGVPRKTLYRCMEAVRKGSAQSFVGSGRIRADYQRVRDRKWAMKDLQEENAILK